MKKSAWFSALALVFLLPLMTGEAQALSEDTNTKVLIQSETTNGSTTFTDSSPLAHPVTFAGDAKHSTSAAKFGASSIYLDGNGDYVSLGTSSDWEFGTGNFTIDGWFRFTSIQSSPGNALGNNLLTTRYDTNNVGGVQIYLKGNVSNRWAFGVGNVSANSPTTPVANTWYHVAVVRNANTFTLYVNGTSQATLTTSNSVIGGECRIGHMMPDSWAGVFFNGHVEELRISKGIARWTANFTPPNATYYFLATPVLNTPTAGNAQVQLSWNAVSNATGYKVKYGTTSGSYPTVVTVTSGTSSTITGLTNGTPYYFVVTAYDSAYETAPSSEQTATPLAPAPPAATTLSSATGGASQVALQWTAVPGATAYRVKYGTTAGSYPTVVEAGSGTSYTVTGLTNNTTYYFVMTAYNGNGESPVSNEKNATPFIPGAWAQNVNNLYFNTGNVGIGTQNPQTALAVNGTITAKEVQVTTSGWADFVFAPNYVLKPLPEVETFVNQKGHLPGFPSEKQLLEGGIPVSEMFKLQTQKIEELTLYVIALQKKVEKLESQNTRSNNQ